MRTITSVYTSQANVGRGRFARAAAAAGEGCGTGCTTRRRSDVRRRHLVALGGRQRRRRALVRTAIRLSACPLACMDLDGAVGLSALSHIVSARRLCCLSHMLRWPCRLSTSRLLTKRRTGFNGQFSGLGLFDVLSGRVSPGGRMPYTVPASVEQLPVITNYAYHPQDPTAQDFMGRTYQVRENAFFEACLC